jgi:hypothetical protein
MPTSATGGYLNQTAGPTEGVTLQRFLQQVIVGVSGLPGNAIRPLWQANPPPLPDITANWCAFGIVSVKGDANVYQRESSTLTSATIERHEQIEVRCSFYGPDAMDYANRLRDGLQVAQNREQLFLAGMGINGFSDLQHIPDLVNDRFYNRADMTITISREVKREYSVLPFLASGWIIATETLTRAYAGRTV